MFLFEMGVVLMVIPWSNYWDKNFFIQEESMFRQILMNNFVRGGISGLGLVNLFLGVSEIASQFITREPRRNPSIRSLIDEP